MDVTLDFHLSGGAVIACVLTLHQVIKPECKIVAESSGRKIGKHVSSEV